jgi:hypothetical protein
MERGRHVENIASLPFFLVFMKKNAFLMSPFPQSLAFQINK